MSKTECLKSIKFITLLLFASFNLYAQITLAECLPKNRIKSDIEAYVEKAQGTLKNLDLLQSDIGALEVSPKLLFTIDFNDSESVERRVVELTKLLKSKGAQREPFRTWQACLGGGEQELVLKAIQVENEVNLARLRFLELPEEKRQNLIKIIADAEQQRQILSEINQKNQAAQTQIEQAQENISMAENVAAKSDDMYVKQLSADWALLEKYKEDLASIQIAESKKQKERMDRYQEIREELANTSVAKVADLPEVKAQFESSTKIWRRMVDNVYELLSGNALPKVPALPEKVLIKSEAHDEVTQKILDDYLKSYAEAEQNRAKLEASLNEISRKEKEVVSRLLLKSGGVRAELFQKAIELEGGYSFSITNENVSDLGREIQVIPFRPIAFFISKSVEFKQKLASGFDGWVNIIQQLIVFSGVIFIPFGLFFILNGISAFIDRWRKNLISKSTIDYRTRTNLVIWLNRLNPYFPLVAMLLATKLADQILQKSDLAELGFFVPYLELYFFYRIFRRALSQGLSVLFIRGDLSALKQKQVRVQDTATKITRLFFAELAILYLTEDAVRQAIMYTLTSKIIFYVNIIFIIYILNQWKVEIQSLAERVLPKVAKQYIHSIYSHKYSYILNPVVFILAAAQLSIQILYKWLSRFDFMKRFSAELFRKKLEDHTLGGQSEARDFTLPDNYKEFFNISKPVPEGAWVNLSKTTLTDLVSVFEGWQKGTADEDALIVYGDKGMGKSALLRSFEASVGDVQTIKSDVPPKITSRADFYKYLSELLGCKIENAVDFLEYDKKIKKTLIIFDNAQNLFLAKQGGFEAYRSLLDIMNLQTQNIFWCLAFNRRSWDYLRGVFGENHYYGKVVEIRPWTDSEIQQLIMKRNRLSGYTLSFDNIISAMQKGDNVETSTEVEAQFFRLLWGQSRGNPRSALVLWISALRFLGNSKLNVSLPEFIRGDGLSKQDDDSLFIYAAIVRHENLALDEITTVTNVSVINVKKCVKRGEDVGLLKLGTDGRFRVTPTGQYIVNNFLLGKNFIYE